MILEEVSNKQFGVSSFFVFFMIFPILTGSENHKKLNLLNLASKF